MPASESDPIARALRGLDEVLLEVRGEKFIPSSQVVFIRYDTATKTTYVHTKDNQAHPIKRTLNQLGRLLPGWFLRVGGFYLVNLDQVHEISGKEGDIRLHFKHSAIAVPVSRGYELGLKRALDVYTLEHLTPFNPFDKFLRQHELIDFGSREVAAVDRTSEPAKEAFRHRWDIKAFPFEQILRYFKQVTTDRVDTVRLIRNLIWQKYRWIVWGIDEKFSGDIRSLWYQVEAALEHHPELVGQASAESFYAGLNYLIIQSRIFKYRDIGFHDERAKYRQIGTKRPGILLLSEKIGHFYRIEEMAAPYEITFGCTKGEVPHITIEYLADELAAAGVDLVNSTLAIFAVTDFDWAGKSIAENIVEFLKEDAGVRQIEFKQLMRLEYFTDQEIERSRTPLVLYIRKDGMDVPYDEETTQEEVDRAKAWFETVGDPRLFSERVIGDRKVYTIWKLSSDAVPWRKIEAVFHEKMKELLGNETPRSVAPVVSSTARRRRPARAARKRKQLSEAGSR